ncbi:MAG: hypothetical protein HC877_23955 [Thioploca sp.]|nr:hypothetical protein [Thioploca sp.]
MATDGVFDTGGSLFSVPFDFDSTMMLGRLFATAIIFPNGVTTTTLPGKIGPDDIRVFISNNPGGVSSKSVGIAFFVRSTVGATIIPVSNNWFDISDSSVTYIFGLTSSSERFSLVSTANGELQYTGLDTGRFKIDIILDLEAVGGAGSQLFQFTYALNGTEQLDAIMSNEIAANSDLIYVSDVVDLNTGDTLKIRGRRGSAASTRNIRFYAARIIVTRIN